MPEVTFIPAVKRIDSEKLRVAAYARVSDAKDAMVNSLEAQVEYFQQHIVANPEWELVDIYVDKGITGTKEERAGFQKMLTDCRAKKIDMVITKAISRFARNTVTLLKTVRELKSLKVDVFFEKENIHTLNGEGELMLSILASFAEAESKSVSDNCKWRIRKGFKEGKINALTMFGYRRMDNGSFIVVPEEAEIIRNIFSMYLEGKGKQYIANYLNGNNIASRCNKNWSPNGIRYILSNEKLVGSLILQKTYRMDYLSKKKSINKENLPQYLIAHHHEPIIPLDTFLKVQEELGKRSFKVTKGKQSVFTGKIVCGDCGKNYKRKSVGKPTGHVWICSTYNIRGKVYCPKAKRISEQVLFVESAKVLGLDEFNEIAFNEKVDRIIVPEPNKLIFQLKNGTMKTVEWKDRSRRESWTDKMKEKARGYAYATNTRNCSNSC